MATYLPSPPLIATIEAAEVMSNFWNTQMRAQESSRESRTKLITPEAAAEARKKRKITQHLFSHGLSDVDDAGLMFEMLVEETDHLWGDAGCPPPDWAKNKLVVHDPAAPFEVNAMARCGVEIRRLLDLADYLVTADLLDAEVLRTAVLDFAFRHSLKWLRLDIPRSPRDAPGVSQYVAGPYSAPSPIDLLGLLLCPNDEFIRVQGKTRTGASRIFPVLTNPGRGRCVRLGPDEFAVALEVWPVRVCGRGRPAPEATWGLLAAGADRVSVFFHAPRDPEGRKKFSDPPRLAPVFRTHGRRSARHSGVPGWPTATGGLPADSATLRLQPGGPEPADDLMPWAIKDSLPHLPDIPTVLIVCALIERPTEEARARLESMAAGTAAGTPQPKLLRRGPWTKSAELLAAADAERADPRDADLADLSEVFAEAAGGPYSGLEDCPVFDVAPFKEFLDGPDGEPRRFPPTCPEELPAYRPAPPASAIGALLADFPFLGKLRWDGVALAGGAVWHYARTVDGERPPAHAGDLDFFLVGPEAVADPKSAYDAFVAQVSKVFASGAKQRGAAPPRKSTSRLGRSKPAPRSGPRSAKTRCSISGSTPCRRPRPPPK
jgi:hypothetical protein